MKDIDYETGVAKLEADLTHMKVESTEPRTSWSLAPGTDANTTLEKDSWVNGSSKMDVQC